MPYPTSIFTAAKVSQALYKILATSIVSIYIASEAYKYYERFLAEKKLARQADKAVR